MPRMNRKPGEKAKDFKGTLKKLIKYAGRYRIGIIAVMICAIASATFWLYWKNTYYSIGSLWNKLII